MTLIQLEMLLSSKKNLKNLTLDRSDYILLIVLDKCLIFIYALHGSSSQDFLMSTDVPGYNCFPNLPADYSLKPQLLNHLLTLELCVSGSL